MSNILEIPIEVVSTAEAASRAKAAWEALPDRSDGRVLDDFIAKFPNSKEAYLAFSLRYQLLRAAPSVDEYHRFITLYRDRVGAEQALYELFDLILAENTLPGYTGFFIRYPESPLARIAELRMHALSFNLVRSLDEVGEYESFLEAFPRAVQVPFVMQLATKKAVEQAQEEYDAATLQPPTPFTTFSDWIEFQGNSLSSDWGKEFLNRFVKLWGLPSVSPDPPGTAGTPALTQRLARADTDQEAGPKLLSFHRLERLAEVLTTVYKGTDASKDFLSDKVNRIYWQAILGKLEDIDQTLQRTHDELLSVLKEELQETRQVLKTGFDRLEMAIKNLDATVTSLQGTVVQELGIIANKLDVLHFDLNSVQSGLKDIWKSVQDVNKAVENTNLKLGSLDQSVQAVRKGIQDLNTNVSKGFQFPGQTTGSLGDEILRGFKRTGKSIVNLPSGNGVFPEFATGAQGGYARIESHVGRQAIRYREIIKQAGSTIVAVSRQVDRETGGVVRDVKAEAGRGAENVKRAVNRALSGLDRKIVAFDVTTDGQLSFNLATGTNQGEVAIPIGVTLDTQAIAKAQLPSFDFDGAIKAAARALGFEFVITNDYQERRAKLQTAPGNDVVYFSSQRFVEWAGPETLCGYVAKLITTQGSTATDIIRAMAHQLLLEFNEIYGWLTSIGKDAVDELLDAVIEAIIFQRKPQVQIPDLQIDVIDITYTYELRLGRGTDLLSKFFNQLPNPMDALGELFNGGPLDELAPELADLLSGKKTSARVTHNAVVISWSGTQNREEWLKSRIDRFEQSKLSVNVQAPELLFKKFLEDGILKIITDRVAIPPAVLKLAISAATGSLSETVFRDLLFSQVTLKANELLPFRIPGSPILDLATTPTSRLLKRILEKMAMGNEGSANVTLLELDLTTYAVSMRVAVRHRHVWSLSELLASSNQAAKKIAQEFQRLKLS